MTDDDNNNHETEKIGSQNFGDAEALALHQLRILEWAAQQERSEAEGDSVDSAEDQVPAQWILTKDVDLYDWQKQCVDAWFDEGKKGTIKVVTGAGKTLLALAVAERLQNSAEPDLCVAVVVPTIVLMNQWYEELLVRSNLPASLIGRLGGGYKEDFGSGRRVLLSVLASARRFLPEIVGKAGVGDRLLFVADECHRVGAKQMSKVLDTKRTYNIGLSATPERDEDEDALDEDANYEESLTGKELGRIVYELTYADALQHGIIPPFTIHHYGIALSPEERQKYDRLTRSINDDRNELRDRAPADARSGSAFYRWIRSASSKGSESAGIASRLTANMRRRKEVLYRMAARYDAVYELLQSEFQENPDARILLFHERINEAMNLFCRLRRAGFPVVAEHGELPGSIRENGLELFREGVAKVMVSVKSLIEGFNVPAVDVGIIVASTSSVRQRIQSLGRVLRKHRTSSGEENTSCIRVVYARDTVDDLIYSKLDWEKATGIDRNIYYNWDIGSPPIKQDGPPHMPLPGESEIDAESLNPGDIYPGAYEGAEYTCDTNKNISDSENSYAKAPELAEKIIQIKGQGGRFKITPKHRFVLVRVPDPEEDWVTKYVCTLDEELDFGETRQTIETTAQNIDDWVAQASAGDGYPFKDIRFTGENFQFRRKRGGIISKRVPKGEAFARVGERANDNVKGADAQRVLDAIRKLANKGERITNLELNEEGHLIYHSEGELRFLCALDKGLEFPGKD